MTRPKKFYSGPVAPDEHAEISQYLKVARSTMRFKRLVHLAKLAGCSWQILALEAIDRLLEEELSHPGRPRIGSKLGQK